MGKVELLAPAGDYECFLAAMRAGADAVYLSGSRFGARAYAKNFTKEELIAAIHYARLHQKAVHLTVNTLFKDAEIEELYDYIRPLYEEGLQAVIVQDVGAVSLLRKAFPDLEIHASTQMTLTDYEGVAYLETLGANRCVLARELSLEEIKRIIKQTKMPIECFVHGALCYSYSGKCLFSSLVGGRSGNRGRCAQPCRLPYDGTYCLSCKDLSGLSLLKELLDAGIASLKIEGRMKSPDYVGGVTGIYRKYIDLYETDPERFFVEPEDTKDLLTLYTRSGNCEGYYHSKNGKHMITMTEPGYQKGMENKRKSVYEKYASFDKDIKVNAYCYLRAEEPVMLTLMTEDEKCVTVSGEIVSYANKQPLQRETIERQLLKTGGTDFEISEIQIEMEDNLFLPVGKINELRRAGFEELTRFLLDIEHRGNSRYISRQIQTSVEDSVSNPLLHAFVTTKEQLDAVLKEQEIKLVTIPAAMLDISGLEKTGRLLHEKKRYLYLALPVIIRREYFKRNDTLTSILNSEWIDGVLINNYESLGYLNSIDFQKEIVADFLLYSWNSYAIDALRNTGVTRTCTPVELNKKEIKKRNASLEDVVIYGRLPMMVSAQCVYHTKYGCDHQNHTIMLKDRFGNNFPCRSDCNTCTSYILNSVPLSLHSQKRFLDSLSPFSYRLLFTTETKEETEMIVSYFLEWLHGSKEMPPYDQFTKGHLERGVE